MLHSIFRISLLITGFISMFLINGNSQLITGKLSSTEARRHIQTLEKGALIVPLFKQLNRQATIREMIGRAETDEKTREKLRNQLRKDSLSFEGFNQMICNYFTEYYRFSKVYFIYDHQLKLFNPRDMVFVDPSGMLPDPSIPYEGEAYYFLQYFSYASPATSPGEVHFFYIADQQKNRLNSPFPFSPGRKNSFIRRFRQLIGMEPAFEEQIKILTIKLNEQLVRYSQG